MKSMLRRVEELCPAQRAAMRALLGRHFDGVSDEVFEADLAEKNWVLLFEEAGVLVAFSTLLLYPFTHAGERVTVVYSGDTIVDPAAWGTSAVSRSWVDSVHRLHAAHGRGRLLWLLISSGFRTYRFLSIFCRDFHPRHDAPTPPEVAALRDALAMDRFGAAYCPASGVVRFPHQQCLGAHLAGVPEERLGDPHVAFFHAANPGHARGDELVCLTDLSIENFTPAGRRMVRAGAARGAEDVPGR